MALADARDLYLVRTYAYVAAGAQGLAIIDVERPEAPGPAQFFNAGGSLNDATGVTVAATYAGQYAYVADGKNGLKVVRLIDTARRGISAGVRSPSPKLSLGYRRAGPRSRWRRATSAIVRTTRAGTRSGSRTGWARGRSTRASSHGST